MGVLPNRIIVEIQAQGGGGASSTEANGVWCPGGGGGGGAYFCAVLNFADKTSWYINL